jgi:hypothetical protein
LHGSCCTDEALQASFQRTSIRAVCQHNPAKRAAAKAHERPRDDHNAPSSNPPRPEKLPSLWKTPVQTVAILSHSKKLRVDRQRPNQKIGCSASQLSEGFPLPLWPQESWATVKYPPDFLDFVGSAHGSISVRYASCVTTSTICRGNRANKQQKPAQIKSF